MNSVQKEEKELGLKPGRFYKCQNGHLYVYPSRYSTTLLAPSNSEDWAITTARWWSSRLKCEVGYLDKEEIFLVMDFLSGAPAVDERQTAFKETPLDAKQGLAKILRPKNGKIVWIAYESWIKFEEITPNN